MANGSIRLHPEHGLNPTMPICFWCGKSTGEVALLGFNRGKEAPRHVILNKEPCPNCQANWKLGLVVIEVDFSKANPPNIEHATGNWCVMKWEAAERVLGHLPIWPSIQREGKLIIDDIKQFTEGGTIEEAGEATTPTMEKTKGR